MLNHSPLIVTMAASVEDDEKEEVVALPRLDAGALYHAVQADDFDAIDAHLEDGGSINDQRYMVLGSSPLSAAARGGKVQMAKLFLEHGADVTAQNSHGTTALLLSAEYGKADVTEAILEARPKLDLEHSDGDGDTALLLAAQFGDPRPVKMLLDCGADVWARRLRSGWTALMWACANAHADVVLLLLDHVRDTHADGGIAYVNAVDALEHSVLRIGVERLCRHTPPMANMRQKAVEDMCGILRLLLERGAKAHLADRYGVLPHHVLGEFEGGWDSMSEIEIFLRDSANKVGQRTKAAKR